MNPQKRSNLGRFNFWLAALLHQTLPEVLFDLHALSMKLRNFSKSRKI